MAESVRWRADPHGGGGDNRGGVDDRRSGGGLGCDGGHEEEGKDTLGRGASHWCGRREREG
jgi:hypothetical protein